MLLATGEYLRRLEPCQQVVMYLLVDTLRVSVTMYPFNLVGVEGVSPPDSTPARQVIIHCGVLIVTLMRRGQLDSCLSRFA